MRGPGDPVEHSDAGAGEVADSPSDVTVIEVTDEDDDVVGLFVKWDGAEWIWADVLSFQSLDESR